MADQKTPASAPAKSKGTQYRALTNVSFGKDRSPVKAGEIFSLDDDDQAKDLIGKGVITKQLKPTDEELAAAANPVDPNKGEPPNAAMTRGMEADAKNAGVKAPEAFANTGTDAAKDQQKEVQGKK